MKSTITLLSILFFLFISTSDIIAQNSDSNGSAQLVELVNGDTKFKVPGSKTWHITNVFCDRAYQSEGEKKESLIVLKSINDVVFEKGPVLASYNNAMVMNFPIILKEGTSFELTVKNSGGKAIMTYIEYDN
jgi:uncharacterized protein YxeA